MREKTKNMVPGSSVSYRKNAPEGITQLVADSQSTSASVDAR
jgi:hypothetical protein